MSCTNDVWAGAAGLALGRAYHLETSQHRHGNLWAVTLNPVESSENSIDAEILAAFFEDATDVLEQWERFCLAQNPSDGPIKFDVILRCAHNLKGSAGMAGFMAMHHKLHKIEDYLVQMQKMKVTATDDVIEALLDVERFIRRWMGQIKANPLPTLEFDDAALVTRLERVVNVAESPVTEVQSASELNSCSNSSAIGMAGSLGRKVSETVISRVRLCKNLAN